jgi:hypothetical protein
MTYKLTVQHVVCNKGVQNLCCEHFPPLFAYRSYYKINFNNKFLIQYNNDAFPEVPIKLMVYCERNVTYEFTLILVGVYSICIGGWVYRGMQSPFPVAAITAAP